MDFGQKEPIKVQFFSSAYYEKLQNDTRPWYNETKLFVIEVYLKYTD